METWSKSIQRPSALQSPKGWGRMGKGQVSAQTFYRNAIREIKLMLGILPFQVALNSLPLSRGDHKQLMLSIMTCFCPFISKHYFSLTLEETEQPGKWERRGKGQGRAQNQILSYPTVGKQTRPAYQKRRTFGLVDMLYYMEGNQYIYFCGIKYPW